MRGCLDGKTVVRREGRVGGSVRGLCNWGKPPTRIARGGGLVTARSGHKEALSSLQRWWEIRKTGGEDVDMGGGMAARNAVGEN